MIVWNLLMTIRVQQSVQGIHFLQNYLRNGNPILVLTTPGHSNTHSFLSPHDFLKLHLVSHAILHQMVYF